jgi:predicted nuclease with TOPRIM domain
VKKNGLEVGKMTTTLLQKVEELTLHMIEMNKKIEKLEKENVQLKEEIIVCD